MRAGLSTLVGRLAGRSEAAEDVGLVIGESVYPRTGAEIVLSVLESNPTLAFRLDPHHLKSLTFPDPKRFG
jgi:hypothetical protein